jgi:hypothetical protein
LVRCSHGPPPARTGFGLPEARSDEPVLPYSAPGLDPLRVVPEEEPLRVVPEEEPLRVVPEADDWP